MRAFYLHFIIIIISFVVLKKYARMIICQYQVDLVDIFLDNQGQKQQIDYMVRDFVPCDNLSDFINSKNKQL